MSNLIALLNAKLAIEDIKGGRIKTRGTMKEEKR
jgi:hypothetical protein